MPRHGLWFFQRENLEALLKEANHFPVEFAELPSLQRLVSLAKAISLCLLYSCFLQIFSQFFSFFSGTLIDLFFSECMNSTGSYVLVVHSKVVAMVMLRKE